MRSVMLQINEYDDDDDGSLNMKTKHKEADGWRTTHWHDIPHLFCILLTKCLSKLLRRH